MNISIAYTENKTYPSKNNCFRPSKCYPEMPFPEDISPVPNDVYDMVREVLHLCGLDQEHYGSADWNPLGEIIQPGNKVLLKPNLVMHHNHNQDGIQCLYTQPSVTAAVIDYVIIALKGHGTIIIGDAPMQECQFDLLIKESGYDKLVEYYVEKGIDIQLCDFRNVKTYVEHSVHKLQTASRSRGILVDMTRSSSFQGLSGDQLKNMRITNYDPRILPQHHNQEKHEYLIAEEILQSDVIINLPKPKTHRKAGITACLKNLVGINANKEYLPHHTNEGRHEKGDAYKHRHLVLRAANYLLDRKNILESERKYIQAQILHQPIRILSALGKKVFHEKYSEGSWYGNETIWRTILDLNKALIYADRNGQIQKIPQRRVFHIADMIISGENDGPINPNAKPVGIIMAGGDAVAMDEVITALMGFDWHLIPTLREARKAVPPISGTDCFHIVSNNETWNEKDCDYIRSHVSLQFVPNPGWKEQLMEGKKL